MPRKKYKRVKLCCQICGQLISRSNMSKHLQRHEKHPESFVPKRIYSDNMCCQFCGKQYDNKNGLAQHENHCSYNPNRIVALPTTGLTPWNKGQTKNNNPSILQQSESLKKYYIAHPERRVRSPLSAETIEKLRQSGCGGFRKRAGRGKKGVYKGYYCDSTYELVYIIYCLDHNISVTRNTKIYYNYEYKGKNYKYYPDFIVNNNFIEIKGYHSEVVDIKTASVTDRNIQVLYRDDLKLMFDYVKQNYSYQKITDLYD